MAGLANVVVVGAQWGDEAKGKLVDYLARDAAMVVRYGGGNNAGHTVTANGIEYKFHLIPAGILNPQTICVVSDGVVIDPAVMVKEIAGLIERGISVSNVKLSSSAHTILPYHMLLDALQEARRGDAKIGTTGRGIGPAYADKAARIGIRLGEFVDPTCFANRLRSVLDEKNALIEHVYGGAPIDFAAVLDEYTPYAEALRPFVCDTASLIYKHAAAGDGVIFEGAQGTLLDLDLGTYPFVTSSHPIAGGACIGTGVGPTMIDSVIGVAKCYTTRVGAGAFPTELLDDRGDYIRERGHEYGTTTGRPRRCGWLDTVILRFSARVNGLSALALGHLDVLTGMETVQICVAYKDGRGNLAEVLPADLAETQDYSPVYETLAGWTEDLSECKTLGELPINAAAYVKRVAELTGVPLVTLSVGPGREQTILVESEMKRVLTPRTAPNSCP
jgi:adenylosuccinate synthase